MRNRKNYLYRPDFEATEKLIDGPCPWVWQLSTQKIDFRRWKHHKGNKKNAIKDRGVILNQLRDAMWQLRHDQSDASLVTLYSSGVSTFLYYIDSNNLAINSIADISKDDLLGYVKWLKDRKSRRTHTKTSYVTARREYTSLKTLLMFFSSRGAFDRRIFPSNPFPNANRYASGTTAYTKSEMSRIVSVLAQEYKSIKLSDSNLSLRHQLTVL